MAPGTAPPEPVNAGPNGPQQGGHVRFERSRYELAKAWRERLEEHTFGDETGDLASDRVVRLVPELVGDLLRAAASKERDPYRLSGAQRERAAALAELRQGELALSKLTRDVAVLRSVVIEALRQDLGERHPDAFVEAVERVAEAAGAVQAAAIEERVRDLQRQANTDPLTGLYNRRCLQRNMTDLLDMHRRYGHPFGVLLVDVDDLKGINDAHGHPAGDRVLVQIAESIRSTIRAVDTAARLGGDEFCVLAPNQDAQRAAILGERLAGVARKAVSPTDLAATGISIGVVACPEHGDQAETLIDGADRGMYRAKRAGQSVAVAETKATAVAAVAKRRPGHR